MLNQPNKPTGNKVYSITAWREYNKSRCHNDAAERMKEIEKLYEQGIFTEKTFTNLKQQYKKLTPE